MEGATASAFLAAALRPLIAAVRATAPRVIASRGQADGEAVHDFRVALRRLRTLLRPARRAFGRRQLRPVEEGLRAYAGASSALRDEEVLRETLAELALDPTTRVAVDAWLARRTRVERELRAEVIRLVEGQLPAGEAAPPPLEACLARLARRLDRPRRKPRPADALARRSIDRALAEVQAFASADPADAEAMHELRIRFKRLRYAAEVFAPLLGEGAVRAAECAARMQKRLGNLHDADEALARVRRARKLDPPARAALLSALTAARTRLAEKATADLVKELPALVTACGGEGSTEQPKKIHREAGRTGRGEEERGE